MGTVDVSLRAVAPDEDLLYFVRKYGRSLGEGLDCRVVIEQAGGKYLVQVWLLPSRQAAGAFAGQEDTDVFLAVRNTFCILAERMREQRADSDAAE